MNTECRCSLRIRLVGDGCEFCNPQFHAELIAEQEAEERASAPALSTEPTADKARRSQNRVHNHGPEEGKGLGCKETLVDGKLRGECLDWYGDQGS